MISVNITLKRNIYIFLNEHLATDVCILLDEKYEYKKVANFITSVISAMKVHHFTARAIARNQLFRLVIVDYSVQTQPKTYYFEIKFHPLTHLPSLMKTMR